MPLSAVSNDLKASFPRGDTPAVPPGEMRERERGGKGYFDGIIQINERVKCTGINNAELERMKLRISLI